MSCIKTVKDVPFDRTLMKKKIEDTVVPSVRMLWKRYSFHEIVHVDVQCSRQLLNIV